LIPLVGFDNSDDEDDGIIAVDKQKDMEFWEENKIGDEPKEYAKMSLFAYN